MLSKVRSWKLEAGRLASKIFVILILFFGISSYSQCAMCRAALESEGNTVKAEAVNDGIVYLMAIPYILVGIAGIFVYRMYSKKKTN
jgi:hypothetical protein